MSSLSLHRGASLVSREEVDTVELPKRTTTFVPISHGTWVNEVITALKFSGLEIERERHGLSRSGNRYFGVFEMVSHNLGTGRCLVVGLRNSHDKAFAAELVAGTKVFVCDNLSFCGEIKIARKHTRNIERDIPRVVTQAVEKLGTHWSTQHQKIYNYKEREITDDRAGRLILECVKRQVFPKRDVMNVLEAWENPIFEEFQPRTLWSLFNAVTEVGKRWGLDDLYRRTRLLHGLCDAEVGIAV